MTTQPGADDLRGLARGMRQLVEIAAGTLADDAGPNELARRVTDHLGCELSEIVPVTERFPIWDHVNVQRGVDACLAARGSTGTWFGAGGGGHRPDEGLEMALADRPGRVDLAVEIPRPDAACRERLLRLYARGLAMAADGAEVAAATDGVTASFVKELSRRAVLTSLRADEHPPVLRGEYFAAVLGEMNSEHHALTRSLLGSDDGDREAASGHTRSRRWGPHASHG